MTWDTKGIVKHIRVAVSRQNVEHFSLLILCRHERCDVEIKHNYRFSETVKTLNYRGFYVCISLSKCARKNVNELQIIMFQVLLKDLKVLYRFNGGYCREHEKKKPNILCTKLFLYARRRHLWARSNVDL